MKAVAKLPGRIVAMTPQNDILYVIYTERRWFGPGEKLRVKAFTKEQLK